MHVSRSVVTDSSQPHRLLAARLLCPGKNTGVGCHALLKQIFLTQRSNLALLHGRQILYCLSHLGSAYVKTNTYLKLNLEIK